MHNNQPNRGTQPKTERNQQIRRARAEGMTIKVIAATFGISYQRAYELSRDPPAPPPARVPLVSVGGSLTPEQQLRQEVELGRREIAEGLALRERQKAARRG